MCAWVRHPAVQVGCTLSIQRDITLECPTCLLPCEWSCMCEKSTAPVHTNLILNCPLLPSFCFMHFSSSSCICLLPLFSSISGYSPFTSFPSKALAANPVSDLPSPLDLGNQLISVSHSFHMPCNHQILSVPAGIILPAVSFFLAYNWTSFWD